MVTYKSTNNMEMMGKDQVFTARPKNKSKISQIKPVGSHLTCRSLAKDVGGAESFHQLEAGLVKLSEKSAAIIMYTGTTPTYRRPCAQNSWRQRKLEQ